MFQRGPSLSGSDRKPEAELVEPLTRREREILGLLAAGHSAPEIAEQLTLAVSSVKWHIQQLYGKLGVNNKQRALLRAAELGLLGAPAQAEPKPSAKHNLPLQVTTFFGREAELAQLQQRLAEHRLVTLTGSGGVGKTRLSVRLAEEVLTHFADGVWFVALASLSDPALVPQQAAAALGVRDEPGRPIVETLAAFLRDRQLLLVLDNCEHVLEASARLADALLHACPRLSLLVSSREALGVAGEAAFPVPSLPFPDPRHLPAAETLAGNVALRLFVDRARLVLPDYALDAGSAPAVARICQRLDGIPLAIEMAAARVNLLTAQQLADRLDDAFRLLTGGSRTALPRQQTLRETLDWSYKLLSEPERILLQRLSVFAGGASLEAIEAVCAEATTDDRRLTTDLGGQQSLSSDVGRPSSFIRPSSVLELLGSLVAKSMVLATRRPDGQTRYHLYEVVRQYAREKLNDGGDGERLRTRHRDYFAGFAHAVAKDARLTGQHLAATRTLTADRDNLRLALEWSFSEPGGANAVESGPHLVDKLFGLWPTHQEELAWLRRALAWCQSRRDVPPLLQAEMLGLASNRVARDDPPAALQQVQQAVDICRGLGPQAKRTLVISLFILGKTYAVDLGEIDQGIAPLAEAEALLQELGPDYFPANEYRWVAALIADMKAHIALHQRLYPSARLYAAESVQHFEAIGNTSFVWLPYLKLGFACLRLGEYDQAREHFLQSLRSAGEMTEDVGDNARSAVLYGLADLDMHLGNLEQARDYCRQSLPLALGILDYNLIASGIGHTAILLARQNQPLRAARLAGAAQALYARQHRKPREDSSLDTILPGWRAGPQQAALLQAYQAGQALPYDQAAALALDDAAP